MGGLLLHRMTAMDGLIADFRRRLAGNCLLHLDHRERSNRQEEYECGATSTQRRFLMTSPVTEGNPRGGDAGDPSLEALNALVGTWEMEATFPGDPPIGMKGGQCVIEWILGGRFLLMRTQVDAPTAPDSTCVIALDSDGAGYTQHYFDERGVVRLYAMTLDAGNWTLTREAPDFSPLDFTQRFTATVDGNEIRGEWQTGEGDGWSRDFALVYRRR